MKYGESARFTITHVDRKGRGCGKVNDRPACTYFTVPGEEVEGTLIKRRKGVRLFRNERVITPSQHRITPRCAFSGICGGCAWQQFDYALQLELKKGLINESFASHDVPARIEKVEACPDIFNYRNRMDHCIGPEGQIGLKEPGRWNTYIDLTECHLLSEDATRLLNAFRDWFNASGLEPWNPKRHEGFGRYLVIREGKNTGKRMVTFVTSEGRIKDTEGLIDALAPYATTIYHGINPTITDVSRATTLDLLHGDILLEERIGGLTFMIHPNAFFQTNSLMAARLAETVSAHVHGRKTDTLLDLYCGVGFLGLSAAKDVREVIGVEIEPTAIDMAKANADRNGITNASFFAGKAERHVWEDSTPDTVILDPSRAGLHPKVIATLLEKKPKTVIYVSCNHDAFAREWGSLRDIYTLEHVQALDLFPHSPHMELVSLLIAK